jgi:thiosulfate/3-mercaptopyruvate sulfurtransferase
MMKLPAAIAVSVTLFSAERIVADGYPRGELLVETALLAAEETSKQFVVLDARVKAKYLDGHVPGARWVDHTDWAKSFGNGDDAEGWSKRIGGLGVTADSKVVVYDDVSSRDAARIWWILRYWGAKDVRLLNGGWIGWSNGKFSIEKGEVPTTPATFRAQANAGRIATKDELLESLKGTKLQIVDARSEKEHCGIEAMKNKRAGAMPGAKNIEWIDLLDKPTQRFKSAAELRKLFADSGVVLDRPTATHCQSGGRAAVMAFALELMGAKDVKNYHRSWSEWGNAEDTPIVKPSPKGKG